MLDRSSDDAPWACPWRRPSRSSGAYTIVKDVEGTWREGFVFEKNEDREPRTTTAKPYTRQIDPPSTYKIIPNYTCAPREAPSM